MESESLHGNSIDVRTPAANCGGNGHRGARLGGDEFAIILDNCPEPRAGQLAQQLLQALNPVEIDWKSQRCAVDASIGLAAANGMPNEKAWMEAADAACYSAKRAGRGRLGFADP
jgi:diguanylate cyclase (GGDEF)-like protein